MLENEMKEPSIGDEVQLEDAYEIEWDDQD